MHVLYDLIRRGEYSGEPIIALGSSHGGYIANLLSKFAPNTLSAVFDNSSYPSPPLHYVIGRDLRQAEASCRAPSLPNLVWLCNVKSGWSSFVENDNYFSKDRQEIRCFSGDTLTEMADYGGNRTVYRFYHSAHDAFVPACSKLALAAALRERGFDVYEYVMDEEDVDGRFVKNLSHGMGLSLRLMFERLYATVDVFEGPTDIGLRSEIMFRGETHDYVFRYGSDGVRALCRSSGWARPARAFGRVA